MSVHTMENRQNLDLLTMINDSGGMPQQGMEIVEEQQQHHHLQGHYPGPSHNSSSSTDLIATALDAANICERDASAEENYAVESAGGEKAEEGIIFRNPSQTSSSIATNASNSKVHFISNLTLIAKQQQQQQQQQATTPRTAQNIIFLNNGGSPSAADKTTGSTPNFINAFVSKGVATTASGKVVNLLHSGPKSGATTMMQQQLRGKRPQPQQLHRTVGTTRTTFAGACPVPGQRPSNFVIASATGPSAGSVKSFAGGKVIGTGLYSTMANKVVVPTAAAAAGGNEMHKMGAKYTKSNTAPPAASTKLKGTVSSKYQPKVVQVQHSYHHHQHPQQSPSRVLDLSGNSFGYTTHIAEENEGAVGQQQQQLGKAITGKGLNSKLGVGQSMLVVNSNGAHGMHSTAKVVLSGRGSGNMKIVSPGPTTTTTATTTYTVLGEEQQQQQVGSTIKYVNAHGNVIQQIHVPSSGSAPPVKYKSSSTVGISSVGSSSVEGVVVESSAGPRGPNVIQYETEEEAAAATASQQQQQQHQTAEEVYYVNGTQMNDEMSARLLQNFSQKATSRYVAQAATTTGGESLGGGGGRNQYSAQGGRFEQPASGGNGGYQKQGPDYIRVNTSGILQAGGGARLLVDHSGACDDPANTDGNNNSGDTSRGAYQHHHEQQQRSLSEERSHALQAVLQDHTYVLLRPGDQKPGHNSASGAESAATAHPLHLSNLDSKELGIAMALVDVGNRNAFAQQQRHQQQQQMKCTTTDLLNAAMGLGHYPLTASGVSGPVDDDNCSVISNDSRSGRAGENDLGEETETAPEGDGEDDSITRCICDLTHDDGYMICCDKCSTWQHVDCMGIDRMNIPDEYKCDVCQPRPMDKNRARTLQLLKRREQQAQLHSLGMVGGAGGVGVDGQTLMGVGRPGLGLGAVEMMMPGGLLPVDGRPVTAAEGYARSKLGAGGVSPAKKAKAQMGARRKSELSAAFSLKKQKRELLKNGVAGKRKEKKVLSKKRTTSGTASATGSLPGSKQTAMCNTMNASVGGGAAAEERIGPKSWAENYEMAMTNHYSPELRARLQAISKQHLQQLMSPTGKSPPLSPGNGNLRNVGDLTGKCTTVPHAGGKILISTLEVAPGEPIVELRGKYMLSGQYRQQTAMGGGGGAGRASQLGRPGGPFIFFYRMVNEATELCVDTRTYGNDARFVRRSCRPNAEIVHHLEKGTIHLYVVGLQLIRSSTEITIKHEPHDLLAVSRASAAGAGDIPQPTSTSCGCGLVKDCLFYSPNAGMPAVEGTRQGKQRLNGTAQKLRTMSRSGGDENTTGPLRRSSSKGGSFRNSRSTSSSGESSPVLISPNIAFGPLVQTPLSPKFVSPSQVPQQQQQQQAEVVVVQGEIKQEVVAAAIKKEELKPNPMESYTDATTAAAAVQKEDKMPVVVEATPDPVTVKVVKEEIQEVVTMTEEKPALQVAEVKKEEQEENEDESSGVITAEVKKEFSSESVANALKSPDTLQAASHKKNKELKSLNEENLRAAASASVAVRAPSSASCEESRKMTREERKMEAIMKAFEKMEKSSMRKQEGRKNGPGTCGVAETTSNKRRSSTSNRKDGDEMSIFRKKKRKGSSKCYQQTGQRRIRRKSSTLANEDVFTSEESTGSLLNSPPISVPYSYPTRPNYPTMIGGGGGSSSSINGDQSSAANMLLSLANAAPLPPPPMVSSPKRSIEGPLSSVFMLVEAAIAPLEAAAASDFKMPKTKKSIMNDWLTADKSGENSPQPMQQQQQPFESLIQAACGEMPSKVEEYGEGAVESTDNRISVPCPFPTPPPSTGGSESAVKKRWLRQAISEECSDEVPTSPTNGYVATPLKKRRFARQCSGDLQVGGVLYPNVDSPAECDAVDPVKVFEERLAEERMAIARQQEHCKMETVAEMVVDEVRNEESRYCPADVVPESTISPPIKLEPEMEAVQEKVSPIKNERQEEASSTEAVRESVLVKGEETEVIKREIVPEAPMELSPIDAVDNAIVQAPPPPPEGPIIPEEFDIEPLHPEEKHEESTKSSGSVEDGSDEIADIQKRLHSFHAENILFLKSMNKKTKPNHRSPQNSESLSAYSSASVSASSSATSSPISSPKTSMADSHLRRHSTSSMFAGKRKKLDFEEVALNEEEEQQQQLLLEREADELKASDSPMGLERRTKRRTKSRFSSPVPSYELKDLNSNTVGMVVKEDSSTPVESSSFKAPDLATGPAPPSLPFYPTGVTSSGSSAGAGHPSAMLPSTPLGGLINTSIPPPIMSSFPPMFTTFGLSTLEEPRLDGGQSQVVASSSRLLLSELLENAQKINSQSSVVGEIPTPVVGSYSLSSSTGAVVGGSSSFGGASAFLTLNTTPNLSKMTFNSEAGSSPVAAAAASRTLIRTASADPRLNPNLNAFPETPPAPKRKLSINEYRKRMQQTPTGGSESASSSANGSPTGFAGRDLMSSGERGAAGMDCEEAAAAAFEGRRGSGAIEGQSDPILESLCTDSNSCASPTNSSSGGAGGCTGAVDEATEKGTFSAAPTLLERQQESISERLRNYKSVTELLTTKDGAPIITTILQNNPLGTSIIESLRSTMTTDGGEVAKPLLLGEVGGGGDMETEATESISDDTVVGSRQFQKQPDGEEEEEQAENDSQPMGLEASVAAAAANITAPAAR